MALTFVPGRKHKSRSKRLTRAEKRRAAKEAKKAAKEAAAKEDEPKAGADIGKIVNLMAGDAMRVR